MTTKLSTVKEISEFLGVTVPRTYELARLYEQSNGTRGLPCIRLGERQLRFSRSAVERALAIDSQDLQKGEVKDNV